MADVTHLNLANNSFVEVPDLSGLTALRSLTLAQNSITQVLLSPEIRSETGKQIELDGLCCKEQ